MYFLSSSIQRQSVQCNVILGLTDRVFERWIFITFSSYLDYWIININKLILKNIIKKLITIIIICTQKDWYLPNILERRITWSMCFYYRNLFKDFPGLQALLKFHGIFRFSVIVGTLLKRHYKHNTHWEIQLLCCKQYI